MDRISKFNDMVSTTSDHIKAVQEAATKYKDVKDPVGLGLEVTGATAGGLSTIAGGITGIQHFKDFKTMYKGLSSKLSNARSRINNANTTIKNAGRGGDGNNADATSNTGANSADGNAPAPNAQQQANAPQQNPQTQNNAPDVDGGVQDRINDLENNPFPNEEANNVNNAINQKVSSELGVNGKKFLNNAVRTAGRNGEDRQIANFPEGDLKTAAQKDFLNFKNKIANDAISRNQAGKTQASGYDADGNASGDLPGPQPNPGAANAVQSVPDQTGVNAVNPANNVNLAPDPNAPNVAVNASGDTQNIGVNLDQNAQGIVARGRAALQNLMGGQQVPGRGGQAVQGLRVNGPGGQNDVNAQANAGANVQQNASNDAQNALAPGRHPNGNPQSAGNQANAGADGNAGGQAGVNPGQGARAGAATADADGSGSAAASGAEAGAEGLAEAGAAGEGIASLSEFAGPAAPIVGLIGGLITLGTTIAGLFHKKPAPVKEAPPPAPVSSIGASLKDTVSGLGGGIF